MFERDRFFLVIALLRPKNTIDVKIPNLKLFETLSSTALYRAPLSIEHRSLSSIEHEPLQSALPLLAPTAYLLQNLSLLAPTAHLQKFPAKQKFPVRELIRRKARRNTTIQENLEKHTEREL